VTGGWSDPKVEKLSAFPQPHLNLPCPQGLSHEHSGLPNRRRPDGFRPDVDANLAEADRLIGEAAAAGARLVVLPEYFR
jgi:hypothetical protein